MKDIYDSTGLGKEELEKFLKNPESLDPVRRQMLEQNLQKSGRNTIVSVIIAVVCFAGLIFGFLHVLNYYTSVVIEQTAPVPGDATRFDPVASYPAVIAHAGVDAKLLSIDAQFVKSDGTMDLLADYDPNVDYDFYTELKDPPKDAPPVGAGSNPEGKWYRKIKVEVYRPGQGRSVSQMGSGGNFSYSYTNRGMDRDTDDPVSNMSEKEVPDPKCSFADLWKTAIAKGAPQGAVASITYKADSSTEKPAYEFVVRDTKVDLNFDADCKLIEKLP